MKNRTDTFILPATLILLSLMMIALLWGSSITQSLWLDEFTSWWTIQGSAAECLSQSLLYQPHSPLYYFLLWCVVHLFGDSELVLRAPSLLSLLLSCLVLGKIATRLIGPGAFLPSILFFIPQSGVLVSATSARPYGLALLLTLLAIHRWITWCDLTRKRDLYLTLFFYLGAVYAHYLFAPAFLVLIGYWVSLDPETRPKVSFSAVNALLLGGIAFYPAWWHMKMVSDRASELALSGSPSILPVLDSLLPVDYLPFLVIALLYAWAVCPSLFRSLSTEQNSRTIYWLLFWHIFPPLFFLGLAQLTQTPRFVSQHFSLWHSPALSLLATSFYLSMTEKRAIYTVPITFGILCLISFFFREFSREDWRGAVSRLNENYQASPGVVLYYSGLVESASPRWYTGGKTRDYLLAPLRYYGFEQPALVLPFDPINGAGKTYTEEFISPQIQHNQAPVYVIGTDVISLEGTPTSQHIKNTLQRLGYTQTKGAHHRLVWEFQFDREFDLPTAGP